MATEELRLFRSVALLGPLSEADLESLVRRVPVTELEGGRLLYTPARRGETVFLLLRGRVRIYRIAGGREFTLSVVEAGDLFGEGALVPGRGQRAYAQTVVRSRIGLLGSEALGRLVREKPEVGLRAMELVARRLAYCEDRMTDMALKEVSARLAGLLLHLYETGGTTGGGYLTSAGYTHEELGAMIGARRVAVSRAMARLRKKGIVDTRRRGVRVLDVRALREAAGE